MDAIAVIGVSAKSIRVILTTERIIYAGKWRTVPDYFDVKGQDAAYRKEFEVLSHWYTFRQCGVQSVQVFENVKVA